MISDITIAFLVFFYLKMLNLVSFSYIEKILRTLFKRTVKKHNFQIT